ncbi:MAG: CotH kinase family protein [Ruminococcus sp.]|uniref:carbohydrate-binding protein n=1 Tax=Ruminococcus sp. TaxID=41978 RepID=UPI0025E62105|nr:carbohydrate-binding protein [Ruminococcus sp.]MBR5682820.1 CotH kinase family protein [Ruminococcus sp.]
MKNTSKRHTIAGILCLGMLLQTASYLPAHADTNVQVSMNEICTKNSSYPAADGKCHDWIELYNSAKTEADISGWGLSDTEGEPRKYVFPEGTRVPAEGRLIVFCDSDAAANDRTIAPFGLAASGETLVLSDKNGSRVQTVTVGALAADASYGQYPDGSGEFYTLKGTPDKANAAPEGNAAVHPPVFSQESGFYDSSFTLTLTADEGCDIYYTTDGSDPVYGSKKYTEPLTINDMTDTENRLSARTDIVPDGAEAPRGNVDKAVVIRAVAVDKENRASEYITKTYFIGRTNSGYYKQMKVVSLVTDPANLFDNNKGIYCLGRIYEENRHSSGDKWPWEIPANYTQRGRDWERPAQFTMFENGKKVIDQSVGIRIKGAFSRCLAQKSFNVYTRKDYGLTEFDYDFFSGKAVKAKNGKAIKKFDGVVLRNGGNDNTGAFFRDSINQSLVADRAFAHQAVTECIVFLDGEFWGIYQMMEKINTSFLSDHYGVKKSDIAMIENGALEEGSEQDLRDWRSVCDGMANGNMSYDEFCSKVDIQGFMDYFAAQIYWSNADWPQNNFSAWRSNAIDETNPYADGKWRMILFDTESGQGLYGTEDKSYSADGFRRIRESGSQLARVFNSLMNIEQFRLKFARTMMDLANHNFNTDRTRAVIEGYKNSYRQQVADTYARFHSGSLSGDNAIRRFEGDISTVLDFYAQRYPYAERTTRSAAGLSSEPRRLTVVNSPDNGSIKLNTLELGNISRWSGNYHTDYDIYIKAMPVEGRTFSHWNINGARITNGDAATASIKVKLESDATVEAVYSDGENVQPVTTTTTKTTTKATTTTTKAATTTTAAIQKTVPVKGLKSLSKVVQAETYDFKSGIDTENCSEGGLDVAYIENGEYIGFKDVDLTNVRNIDFRIGSNGAKAVLEVHIDDPNGQVIGKMDIKSTSGWQTWNTQTCSVSETNGKHDVYFVFTGGEGYLYNVNWWRTDKAVSKYAIGDLNEDGKVDIYDLCSMKKAVLTGEADNFGAADINDDDAINSADLVLLKRFIMGDIKSF